MTVAEKPILNKSVVSAILYRFILSIIRSEFFQLPGRKLGVCKPVPLFYDLRIQHCMRSRIRRSIVTVFFNQHSHTTRTSHPRSFRFLIFALSRFTFVIRLVSQYARLVAGRTVPNRHLWECQKHPWTKITILCLGKTISGRPGRFGECNLNR
jgi:hypothetical protein